MTTFTSYLNRFLIVALVMMIAVVGYRLVTGRGIFIRTDQTAVVKEMRSLNRLETASFTIEKIFEAGTTDGNRLRAFLFGDRLLLIAHAEVIAGVDLSQLKDEDIVIKGNSVTLHLPDTEVFSTDLDESKTRVYDRQRGLLTKGQDNLEGDTRMAAEFEITMDACEAGLMDKATENAKTQMTAFLKALGFEHVTVEVEAGSCPRMIIN